MLKNLPIIPSKTSQNVSLLFFKILPIIPKLFCSDSKKICYWLEVVHVLLEALINSKQLLKVYFVKAVEVRIRQYFYKGTYI